MARRVQRGAVNYYVFLDVLARTGRLAHEPQEFRWELIEHFGADLLCAMIRQRPALLRECSYVVTRPRAATRLDYLQLAAVRH